MLLQLLIGLLLCRRLRPQLVILGIILRAGQGVGRKLLHLGVRARCQLVVLVAREQLLTLTEIVREDLSKQACAHQAGAVVECGRPVLYPPRVAL